MIITRLATSSFSSAKWILSNKMLKKKKKNISNYNDTNKTQILMINVLYHYALLSNWCLIDIEGIRSRVWMTYRWSENESGRSGFRGTYCCAVVADISQTMFIYSVLRYLFSYPIQYFTMLKLHFSLWPYEWRNMIPQDMKA